MSTAARPPPKPCACGAVPRLAAWRRGKVRCVQLRCGCGNRGATLMYLQPQDKARTRWVVVDGWNLSQ